VTDVKQCTLHINFTFDVEDMPLRLSIMLCLLWHRQSVELKFQSIVLHDMVLLGIAFDQGVILTKNHKLI
jgi:hypothetical protein